MPSYKLPLSVVANCTTRFVGIICRELKTGPWWTVVDVAPDGFVDLITVRSENYAEGYADGYCKATGIPRGEIKL